MSTSGDAGKKVSLRNAIDATRRLDELGTARWIEAAAEVVHKAQTGGQPIGKLCPEALTLRDGNVVLDVPMLAEIPYTAPERLRGSSGDRRSDVWSLGVMLWEALAHVRLFEGANDDAVRTAVETAEIVPVNEMNANVPAELGAICTKALQRDPTNRYQSAKAMAAEISAVLDDAGYPEGFEAIEKWIASAAPAPVPAPAPILTPSSGPAKLGTQTIMGLAPIGEVRPPMVAKQPAPAPKPAVVENKTEPLTSMDIIESRAQTAKPVSEVIPLVNPVIPLETKKAAPNDTLLDAKPFGNKPGALTQGWDIPPEPKPDPKPEPARAKSDSKGPLSSLPAWATRPSTGTQPPPIVNPTPAPAAPAPAAPTPAFSPSTTLQGVSNPAIKPPILPEAAPAPVMKLPDAPPGATISADKPAASFATTSVVGSSISTAVPGVAPAPFSGNRTVTMGSNAIIEAVNASVSAANPPPAAAPIALAPTPIAGQSLSPPPVSLGVPAAPVLPPGVAGTPAIKISEAETVNTPAVTVPPTAPQPDIRAVNWDEQAKKDVAKPAATAVEAPTTPNTAVAKLPPKSDDDFTEKESSTGSSSVAKPRAQSRGDNTGTGKKDVLAGWGWGTGSQPALGAVDDDGEDSIEADRQKHKKRMVIVFGALGAAALLVVGLAFAFSGDNKEEEPVTKSTAPIGDPTQAGGGVITEPPKPDPAKPDPAAEPVKPEPDPEPAHEPTVAKTELPKPDPTPAKPEPIKVEPKKPDVVVKKDPPKKPEPIKIEPRKPDPPKKPEPVAKVDAASAYKTGFQLYAKGDTNGALTSFKEALASNPGYAPTWRGIGLVYEKLGRRSQAVTAFKRYLELSPNAGDAEQIRNRLEKLGS